MANKMTAARLMVAAVYFSLAVVSASAIEIRGYSAARHDRFVGFPDAPVWNDGAYFSSRKFTGVGWIPGEATSRQFALVTPKHAVFATHYLPGNGTVIRFLNADGVTVDRTIASSAQVMNADGLATDLSLITLSSPLSAADGVAHFPYLNLANDNAYRGTVLTVFGWHAKAGRSVLSAIDEFEEPGVNKTQVMQFQYRKLSGNGDDGHVVLGDSGSPSFAMAGDVPALVGTHLAAGENSTHYVNYDSFVPFYVTELNALLLADGYQMTPAYPAPVTLSLSSEKTPAVFRQAEAGTCRFDLENSGTVAAGNITLTVHFPAGNGPANLSAPDWIVERAGPDTWELRGASLAIGAVSPVTASWAKLPSQSSLIVEITYASDGSPKRIRTFDLAPRPSYAAWSDGLGNPGTSSDPDADGVINLLEYAFGGDPSAGAMVSEAGGNLLPGISIEVEQAVLKFPIRADAAVRGLSYVLEFSENLEADSWSTTAPAGLSSSDAETVPPVSGFQLRTVRFDTGSAARRFCRVRVGLEE